MPASSTPSHFERSHRPVDQIGVRLRDVPRLRQQQRERLLGGADDVGLRRVHDHHAAPGRLVDVDVVEPDAGARDDLEVGRGGQHVGGHLGGAADDQRVVGRDLGGEVARGEFGSDVDLEVLRQQLEALLGQGLGDEHPHRVSAAPWNTCSAARTAAPSFTGNPSRSSVISSAASPRMMSSSLKYPKCPIRKTFPLSGPCPGARTQPKSRADPVADRVGVDPLGRADRGHRPVARRAPRRTGPSPIARDAVLDGPASISWRASAASTPSWKYSSSAACRPCITLIAGVHGFSGYGSAANRRYSRQSK